MLIKVFTYGPDGFDSLNPPRDGSDFIVGLYQLPRGYSSQVDRAGRQYIECPNCTKIHELDQTARRNAVRVKFSYLVVGKRRTVWLKLDEKATHDMIFSGEDYRCIP